MLSESSAVLFRSAVAIYSKVLQQKIITSTNNIMSFFYDKLWHFLRLFPNRTLVQYQ